jgi:prepilin-type N-terminal cleavage/methylation domain-containing protein
MRLRRGFSLMELLITITMLAIITGFSISRVGTMTSKWQTTRSAQALSEELQTAFALVGRNRQPVQIVIDTAKMELKMMDRKGTVYRRMSFGPTTDYKLTTREITFSRLNLEVYPPGLAADTLSIIITRSGNTRRVRMMRGGLVQLLYQ